MKIEWDILSEIRVVYVIALSMYFHLHKYFLYFLYMPSRNRLKIYLPNTFYHCYNRGVAKQTIIRDEQDMTILLRYLGDYLDEKDTQTLATIISEPGYLEYERERARNLLRLNNFYSSIHVHAFCIMPNHFHFLLEQKTADAMDSFMNSLWTRYTKYFNKKYNRVGPLFQGVYKAVQIETDQQLLYLSRYIHRNPVAHRRLFNPERIHEELISYPGSSYGTYCGYTRHAWVQKGMVTELLGSIRDSIAAYEDFVQTSDDEERAGAIIAPIIADV